MEADPPTSSGINKTSGIPRPTRLPVLKPKSSIPTPQRPQNALEPPKPVAPSTRPQTRPSTTSLRRPAPSSTANPLSSKANGSSHVTKTSYTNTTTHKNAARPAAAKIQTISSQSSVKRLPDPEDAENHDQLGSLDSFRTVSRQGLYDDPAPPAQEYVEPSEVPEMARAKKTSRPSLSDRTMESIQTLPATPKDRRRSSFFSPAESPMGPPPRPLSSQSRNGSNGGSRPGTSDGSFTKAVAGPPSTANKASTRSKPRLSSSIGRSKISSSNPTRRSLSSAFHAQLDEDQVEKQALSKQGAPSTQIATSSNIKGQLGMRSRPGSKTVAARPTKPRPSLSDAFGPAVREVDAQTEAKSRPNDLSSTSHQSPGQSPNTSKKSSAALREQIAAAKAAARKAKQDSPRGVTVSNNDHFETDIHQDPFNQAPKDEKHILKNRINTARTDGKLNIAAMGLKEIPEEVSRMYDTAAMQESRVNWAELVDLTRFNAADNEIEELAESIFPDKSFDDFDMDDQPEGNQFAGLELLDLHGNRLRVLPIGLRRLERLTTLNLSHNRLDDSALDVISQILSLKDLKLGHNFITGGLPSSICQLQHLESLDLQSNRLLSLPAAIQELVSLKVLNVSGNQLTALPMESLHELPLKTLDASENALITSLFPIGGPNGHRTLQSLNVANNSLAALAFDNDLHLPRLHTLDVSCNHLTGLPPMSSWTELVTLVASENKISEIPDDFTYLRRLRNVNFTGNELRMLDPEIARMESLESLILASNPLRERKFLTMTAADIKRNLQARLETDGADLGKAIDGDSEHGVQATRNPLWELKPHDTLDLSQGGHRDEINDSLGSFLETNSVKHLRLQSNLLTYLPLSLAIAKDLRSLDLSGNALSSSYISDDLTLPSLQELNLSKCSITTLEPLTTHLRAPSLHTLNISINRLSGALPALRSTFPALTTLYASDNKFSFVTFASLQGLQVANLASNDIQSLPPEIGLLWDQGLRSLDVASNAFRVPNYRVLEKGTEAVMRWLREKIPAGAGADAEGV